MKVKAGLLLALLCVVVASVQAQQQDETVVVHGQITDRQGNPLEGTKLQLFKREKFISANIKLVKETFTDASGHYTINDIPYGYYIVVIQAIGFHASEMSRVLFAEENNLLDVSLEKNRFINVKEIKIEGTVRQVNQAPLKDVTVTIMNARSTELVQQAHTDQDGKYKFALNPDGQYIIHVSKPGFLSRAATVEEKTNFVLLPVGDK